MQALCIGVNDYKEKTKLKNAIADAEGIARCIENLPDSSARAVCRNPESKGALRREIERFLADIPKESPLRIVLIFYAGHAVQEGNQVFLLPANANLRTPEDLKSMCFSHDEFKLLKEKLDDKIEVEDVLYLIILDACHESLGGISPALDFLRKVMSLARLSASQMGAVHLYSTRRCCLRWRRRAQPVYGSANEC